jgi:hypothetical protein
MRLAAKVHAWLGSRLVGLGRMGNTSRNPTGSVRSGSGVDDLFVDNVIFFADCWLRYPLFSYELRLTPRLGKDREDVLKGCKPRAEQCEK